MFTTLAPEMRTRTLTAEPLVARRVFGSWSIDVPESFNETFVLEDGYWHAYGEGSSVSLTSIVVTDGERLVSSAELREVFPDLPGSPVLETPASLFGRAAIEEAAGPAPASSVLQGLLAADGRLLLVTITSDDVEWARRVWLSIRHHAAPAVLLH